MADLKSKIQEIYSLEQLAAQKTVIHRIHPGAKLLATAVFLVAVVSFNRYELGRLMPYLFYPFVLMALSETPWKPVGKRVLLALPFVLIAGLSNVLLDTAPALYLGSLAVSRGVLSCVVILLRTFLCVTAVLLLVAVTPFVSLTGQLRRAHIPEIFVLLFEMTYRYIGALLEEASAMYTAYQLRHTHQKGLEMKHMGPFVGQLLLKSFDRAERVYAAMKCRGYGRPIAAHASRKWVRRDYVFALSVCVPCVVLRFVNVGMLWNNWIGRWIG